MNYLENVWHAGIPALFFWLVFIYSMHHNRSRYRNTFLLMMAGCFSIPFVCSLTGEYAATTFVVLLLLIILLISFVPIGLIWNGILMWRREGRSLGNLLSLVFGLIIGIGEIATFIFVLLTGSQVVDRWSDFLSHISQGLFFILISVIYVSLVFVSFMFYCLFLQIIPHKRDFDYVIIHGSGLHKDGTVTQLLKDRCDKAIEVYRKEPSPPILVPSGSQGADEVCSEAMAMKNYLLSQGIPENRIEMEGQSTTTWENLKFSKTLIESFPGRHYVALVTSNYHVYRALRYCSKLNFSCTGIGARVASYYWPSALIREFVAVHREPKHLILFLIGYVLVIASILIR